MINLTLASLCIPDFPACMRTATCSACCSISLSDCSGDSEVRHDQDVLGGTDPAVAEGPGTEAAAEEAPAAQRIFATVDATIRAYLDSTQEEPLAGFSAATPLMDAGLDSLDMLKASVCCHPLPGSSDQ